MAREALELVQGFELLEDLRVELERGPGAVAAGATTRVLLAALFVRSRVGAEEELARATGDRHSERLLVGAALEHRQAVVVRADPADQKVVPVQHQVLRGDRRGHVVARLADEVRGVLGGDVLEHHLQRGKALGQRAQAPVDELLLAIEDVDVRIGDLTVHEEQHPVLGQRFEHRIEGIELGDRRVGVGGRSRWIELHCRHASSRGVRDVCRRREVGQVERHQRLERGASRARSEDSVAVGHRLARCPHRRHEVRHHDRASEAARGRRHRLRQHVAVAEVKVPVVGGSDRDLLHGRVPHGWFGFSRLAARPRRSWMSSQGSSWGGRSTQMHRTFAPSRRWSAA